MNAITPIGGFFETAYRQIKPTERAFVDLFVSDIEAHAARTGEKLLTALRRPIPGDLDAHSLAMLHQPLVKAAIFERVQELSEAAELSEYKTLKELRALAYSSIGNYMEIGQDGMPVFDLARCTPEQLSAIKSIKYELNPRGGHKFEFTLHDKLGALRDVMRYQGLAEPENEHWRADKAKTTEAADHLPADITEDGAADAYSRQINGG